jgi:hypothetical protein
VFERVKRLNKDAMKQMDKYDEVYKKLIMFDDKLTDLRVKSRESLQTSGMTTRMNQQNQAYLDRIRVSRFHIKAVDLLSSKSLNLNS